ncbi:MAG: hypothetical protein E7Z74_07520 [Methanobrevibacter millerae]|uniref:Viral late gene transcription factor 3 zinc ribbon domain-containing protein n=1 Tax=Methanobrevibacter millerae TaxID=230361 RepID=A0A8T3VT63_9EURY|nr:hypothetical protein [Methanobrevibacter millerae]
MNELMCEMCGSNIVTREGGFYVCQACGTKFPANDSSSGGTQQYGAEESFSELDNLYELARRANENGDAEFAFKYYSEILIKNPNDWEAQFYAGYFRAYLYDFLDERAIDELFSSISSAVLIVERLDDVEEKKEAIGTFTDETLGLVENYYTSYFDEMEYDGPDGEYYEWYVNVLLELCYLLNNYGDLVEKVTDDSYKDSVDAWIYSIDLHTPLYKHLGFFNMGDHDKYIDEYVEKIHQYNPDYQKPKPKKLFGII